MSGQSVWDLQGEPIYKAIVLKVRMHLNNHVNQVFWSVWAILAEKNEDKVYVNQDDLQKLITEIDYL